MAQGYPLRRLSTESIPLLCDSSTARQLDSSTHQAAPRLRGPRQRCEDQMSERRPGHLVLPHSQRTRSGRRSKDVQSFEATPQNPFRPKNFAHTACWVKVVGYTSLVDHFLHVPTTLSVDLGSLRHVLHLWYLSSQDLGLCQQRLPRPEWRRGAKKNAVVLSHDIVRKTRVSFECDGKKNMPFGSHINLRYFHHRKTVPWRAMGQSMKLRIWSVFISLSTCPFPVRESHWNPAHFQKSSGGTHPGKCPHEKSPPDEESHART